MPREGELDANARRVLAVQVVPHITDAMQEWIQRVAKIPVDDSGEEPDVCISKFPPKKGHESGHDIC